MRMTQRKLSALLAVATVVTLSACSSAEHEPFSSDLPSSDATTGVDGQGTEDPVTAAYALYDETLDGLNLDNGRFSSDEVLLDSPTGQFQYSLADINGDGVPEMLVAALSPSFNTIKVFTVDGAKVVETDQLFSSGASSAGGSRASFETSASGNGVFESRGLGGTGEFTTSRWTLEGTKMVEGENWEYRIDQVPAALAQDQTEIMWTDSKDRSLLQGDNAQKQASGPAKGPNPEPPAEQGNDGVAAGGSLPRADVAAPNQTGVTCGTVDGVSVTAGSNTSCGFAMNVAQQALQPGTWSPGVAPDPTVTAPWGSTTVTASSPTTGEVYTLNCSTGTDPFIARCTGGNNARVEFEKRAQGGLMYLRG